MSDYTPPFYAKTIIFHALVPVMVRQTLLAKQAMGLLPDT